MGLEASEQAGSTGFKEAEGPDPESDKEELKSAKELVNFLVKTTRTLKIYLHNNPIHEKFIKDLTAKFDRHLVSYDILRIQVQQYRLLLGRDVLYENNNRLESLAFRLYMDGIRELCFHKGLEEQEIVGFIEAVGKTSAQVQLDDDISTLLWEKGFTHISYHLAAEGSERLRIDPAPLPQGRITQVFREESSQKGEEKATAAAVTEVGQDLTKAEQELQKIAYQNIYALTEEEISKVKFEMQMEEDRDLLEEMIQILASILQIEENFKDFDEVVRILEDMLDLMVSRGDFFHSRRILEVFWGLQSPDKGLPESHREVAKTAIDRAGNGERIEKLRVALNSEDVRDLDHLHAYLVLHHKNAISPLIDLLGSLNKIKARKILCEAMVELAREDISTLIHRLHDRKWYTVRNIVYILGKIGNEQAVEPIAGLIRHREPQVRKEVLRALEILPGIRAKQHLLKFLKDEDSSIRILAAKSLAQFNVAGAVDQLFQVIQESQFKDRDLYEKKEIFDALGRVGGNAILSEMRRIIRRPSWFRLHKGKDEELKLCAVIALKRVKTPEAIDLLREGAALKNRNVREACLRVLSELEKTKG